ncbi:hypothetical protein niasHT_022619 [Heterodera trifolii]|uniref:Lipocalin domain-containing protein n=1 Tax=Heterodera trifolii TaxID=157864 RepID=A0ABD2JRG2_9BILA
MRFLLRCHSLPLLPRSLCFFFGFFFSVPRPISARATWAPLPNSPPPSEFLADSEYHRSFGLGPHHSFIQEEHSPAWSVSYTAPNDGRQNVRPSHRYVFQGVQFAKPPDPQSIWQEQLNQLKQKDAQSMELMGRTEIPQAIRNYFSLDLPPEKVIKEITGVDLHSLLGPPFDKLMDTTIAPTFTRPTTSKDKLVQYFERSLDNFLDGRYRAMERIPYLTEKEKQMQQQQQKTKTEDIGKTQAALNKTEEEHDEFMEGSGEELVELEENSVPSFSSSISGIPKQIPFIPKVPVDFIVPQEDQPTEIVSKLLELNAKKVEKKNDGMTKPVKSFANRPKAKGAVLHGKSLPEGDGRMAKPTKQYFQYGDKPSYQQGVVSSLLQFMGINNPKASTELDQVLTEWIMDHSSRHVTKQEKKSYGEESTYTRIQKFLNSPLAPLCSVGETMNNFELDSLMGQWFEVMHSPLMSSSMCTMFSYEMLSRSSSTEGVGSVFQTLQFTSPKGNRTTPRDGFGNWHESIGTMPMPMQQQPLLSSGYALMPRPGQIVFRRSNTPEEVNVRVIDASYGDGIPSSAFRRGRRYEYAILGINCNYPLFVIAREPYTFKQKYERHVMETLEKKGLINAFSRLLNIVTGIDPAQCQLPAHLFDAKSHR